MKNSVKRFIALILLICTLALSMASCDFAGIFNKDTGLEYGFDTSNGEIEPNIKCAYRSDKNTFDIDDVTLEFFIGVVMSCDTPEHYREMAGMSYPSFDIYFSSGTDKIIIRTVNENLISEKYRLEPVFDENGDYTGLSYHYSEIFTIPAELFTKETGVIVFGLYGINVLAYEPTYRQLAMTRLYYKVNNGRVTLSNQKFK